MEIYAAIDPFAVVVHRTSRNAIDSKLSTFDLKAKKRIGRFPVLYSGGLRRSSLSQDAHLCFIGCFREHGLAAYSTQEGSEIWRRNDLDILNDVTAFTHDNIVSCRSNEELFLLCSQSGRTLDILHGIKSIYTSPFSKTLLVSARKLELHSEFGSLIGTIPRTTFAELDCAFSKSEVLISESGGPVRCFDLGSAQLLWTHTPPEGSHFLKLCYSQPLNCFTGVWWYYEGKESSDPMNQIFHFDSKTGAVLKEVHLDSDSRQAFGMAGTVLLSQELQVRSVETGKLLYAIE